MTTAVVIPAYNGLKFFKANLPAVLGLHTDTVIVVDDASTDGTGSFIRDTFSGVHLITNAKNQGFTKTVNTGFRSARADIVFLLNQDVRPAPDLVRLTLPYFKKNAKIFALSFNEDQFGYAIVGFVKGFIDFKNRATSRPHSSFWASGGSCAVRKTIWDSLGGFDPVFSPGYYEDLDISWRARKQGWEIIWAPQIRVEHVRETAFKNAYPEKKLRLIKERNFLICQWKNLDCSNLSVHISALFFRCLAHPGFIVPSLMALNYLFPVIAYRHRTQNLLPDNQVFNV